MNTRTAANDSNPIQVLIVDYEQAIVDLLTHSLVRAGCRVTSAGTAEEALDMMRTNDFDFFMLDVVLPGMSGIDLIRIVRSDPKTTTVPVIVLTAGTDAEDGIKALETGADDYITKPFNPRELIARMKNAVRRCHNRPYSDDTVTLGALRIDKKRHSVSKRGIPVHLSAMEFKLLLHLTDKRGKVFSREQLLAALWQGETFVEPRTVDVHIRRLRSRIEDHPASPEYIKTRRGIGYYIDEP